MAVSFVTRFRRQLATIPYVIVLTIPMALATWIWLGRTPVPVTVPVTETSITETFCVEPDLAASPVVDGCSFMPEITSSE